MPNPRLLLRRLAAFSALALALFLLELGRARPARDALTVAFFDVGQGDAIFIEGPSGYQILLDGGPDRERILALLGERLPAWDRRLDLVVLSHPHADHLTGLLAVLRNYEVAEVLTSDALHTTPEFREWLGLLKEKGLKVRLAHEVSAIELGEGALAEVLYPKSSFADARVENLNDTSIVLRVCLRICVLLPGDLEETGQAKLLTDRSKLRAEIMKVPHHGSADALNPAFLAAVSPKLAVISVGKNPYGHPHPSIVKKLSGRGIETLRTDHHGTITVTISKEGGLAVKPSQK